MFKFTALASLLSILILNLPQANAASGGSNVRLDLSYIMLNTSNNPQPNATTGNISGNDAELKQSYMDLKLGYIFSNAIYGGVVYSTYATDGSTGVLPTKRNLLGVTIGYHPGGYYIDLNYYASGKLTDAFASGDEFNTPNGLLGLDFGYDFMMGSNFYLGVQISYKTLTFTKYKANASAREVSTTWKQTELYPMFKLGFVF